MKNTKCTKENRVIRDILGRVIALKVLRKLSNDSRAGKFLLANMFKLGNTSKVVVIDRYLEFSEQFENITLVGRLAENRYYDMDDIVARALQVFEDKFLMPGK
jgi:UDP-galactopyranose mutase